MIEQDGKVAVKYITSIPQTLKVNGKVYSFVVKMSVSMAWVDKEDLPVVMGITKTCCGGSKHVVYKYANELDVHRWMTGKERL
jgi:hypothetical protein